MQRDMCSRTAKRIHRSRGASLGHARVSGSRDRQRGQRSIRRYKGVAKTLDTFINVVNREFQFALLSRPALTRVGEEPIDNRAPTNSKSSLSLTIEKIFGKKI